jgi:hypothetical protein
MAGEMGTAGREQGIDNAPVLGLRMQSVGASEKSLHSRRPSRMIDGIGAAGSGLGRLGCGSEWSQVLVDNSTAAVLPQLAAFLTSSAIRLSPAAVRLVRA